MRVVCVLVLGVLLAAIAAAQDVTPPPPTTYAPGATTTYAPGATTTYAPGATTTYAPGATTTYAPGVTTTYAPQETYPSYPTVPPYTETPGEYYETKPVYHRQIYRAEVNVSNGWINYCPEYHDWYSGAAYEATCNTFRPWNYRELDYSGNVTEVEYQAGTYRQAVSLENWTYIGTSRNASLPACWANGTGPDPCGATDAGAALWYATLPLTVELYAIAEGHVQIDARTFLHRGWYWAGGKNYSVWPGTASYDVSFHGYKFSEYGWAVQFDIQSKYPAGTTTVGNLSAADADALTTPNSRIVCAPRYRASNGSLPLSGWYKDAWVRLSAPGNASGPDLIAKYRFEGPYLNLEY